MMMLMEKMMKDDIDVLDDNGCDVDDYNER